MTTASTPATSRTTRLMMIATGVAPALLACRPRHPRFPRRWRAQARQARSRGARDEVVEAHPHAPRPLTARRAATAASGASDDRCSLPSVAGLEAPDPSPARPRSIPRSRLRSPESPAPGYRRAPHSPAIPGRERSTRALRRSHGLVRSRCDRADAHGVVGGWRAALGMGPRRVGAGDAGCDGC